MGEVFTVRRAAFSDMSTCAEILNTWIDATDWMPRIHPHKDIEKHYQKTVYTERDVYVGEFSGSIVGMMVLAKDGYVTALYVSANQRGKGCGKALLDLAKSAFPKELRLWAFVNNIKARKFYEREGFVEIRRTVGENEEKLADIEFRWRPRK